MKKLEFIINVNGEYYILSIETPFRGKIVESDIVEKPHNCEQLFIINCLN